MGVRLKICRIIANAGKGPKQIFYSIYLKTASNTDEEIRCGVKVINCLLYIPFCCNCETLIFESY